MRRAGCRVRCSTSSTSTRMRDAAAAPERRHDATDAQMIKLYAQYEENCARSGVVDFAELLLRAFELWRDNAELLRHYRARFRTCWWTSSRTPTRSSTRGSGCSSARKAQHSRWAMTINRSIAGAVRAWRICTSFARTSRWRNCIRLEQNYRSTAAILDRRQRADREQQRRAWARRCGPAACG